MPTRCGKGERGGAVATALLIILSAFGSAYVVHPAVRPVEQHHVVVSAEPVQESIRHLDSLSHPASKKWTDARLLAGQLESPGHTTLASSPTSSLCPAASAHTQSAYPNTAHDSHGSVGAMTTGPLEGLLTVSWTLCCDANMSLSMNRTGTHAAQVTSSRSASRRDGARTIVLCSLRSVPQARLWIQQRLTAALAVKWCSLASQGTQETRKHETQHGQAVLLRHGRHLPL